MTDDLKIPQVGELTFPQWQDWLVHYNALLLKRGRRIEKLETALRRLIDYGMVSHQDLERARKALEGKE